MKNFTDVYLVYSSSEQLLKYLSAVYLVYSCPEQFLIYCTTPTQQKLHQLFQKNKLRLSKCEHEKKSLDLEKEYEPYRKYEG